MILIKRLLALGCVLLALLPRWGTFDVSSSLHPDTSGNDFTGLDALRHQACTALPLMCLAIALVLGTATLLEKRANSGKHVSIDGWDKILLAVFAALSIMWVKVFVLTVMNWRDRIFVNSIWYQTLTAAFWFIPVALVLASLLVLLTRKRL